MRRRLHDRYERILLDEFQDTDPIQIELAVRIAAASPDAEDAGSALWHELDIAPGHLFVVGDPKQSIYRFRRADISLFLHARQVLGLDRGALVELDANFRSTGEIIGWVNDSFGALMGSGEGATPEIASQPAYAALRAVRPSAKTGPAVSVIGREAMAGADAGTLRRAEAESVSACVAQAIDERWTVEGDAKKSGRRAKLGDIAVLIPSRSPLPYLERSFAEAGIPYRVESSSLVYSTRAVRDLLMVIRAVDDPTDELSIVSALRTPLLACGDDDLFRFKRERGGRWNYVGDQPDSVPEDDPVRAGLAYLAECHERRRWLAPSELLDKVARDRRCFELGFAEGRPRDVWRRLRFVIDQARGWSDSTGGSLRQYIQWVAGQTQEGARVAEAVLPETDDDAVRIMTIHAAKGLEFPVTIVAGLSTAPGGRPAAADVVFPTTGGVGYRVGGGVATDEYTEWKPIDEQMSFHERIRLLYVACTRASDHLVVSLFRRQRANPPKSNTSLTNAELLVEGMAERLDALPDAVEGPLGARRIPRSAPPSAPPPFAEWEAKRAAAIRTASRPSTIAATALTDEGGLDADEELTDGLEKRPRDMDQPPWLKGRYGSAVGRAVHGVLQTIDLASGDGIAEAVAAQCQAEAIPERIGDVTKLVGDAVGSSIVRAAAAAPHWREVYACTPSVGGRLLEGYIDLLYRMPDGLVVVDYKTAGTNDRTQLDERVEGYRLQGGSYAISVARATGEPVVRVAFLFLTPVARSRSTWPISTR